MHGKLRIWLAAASVCAVVVVVAFATFSSAASTKMTVHVIEHATTDVVIDADGDGADSTGDLLTWHNKIYDAADSKVVGHDQGMCVRISPKQGSWECVWTTILKDGHFTVEGPFYDTRDNVIAVTGGTGAYSNATGNMQLISKNGGTEYHFIFRVTV
jgi:allene oxide cyclase